MIFCIAVPVCQRNKTRANVSRRIIFMSSAEFPILPVVGSGDNGCDLIRVFFRPRRIVDDPFLRQWLQSPRLDNNLLFFTVHIPRSLWTTSTTELYFFKLNQGLPQWRGGVYHLYNRFRLSTRIFLRKIRELKAEHNYNFPKSLRLRRKDVFDNAGSTCLIS